MLNLISYWIIIDIVLSYSFLSILLTIYYLVSSAYITILNI
nr:MAG TPA: hypothetical protein [Crassvirales sp.]